MIKMFETEKYGTYSMDVHSRERCEKRIIAPSDEYYNSPSYIITKDGDTIKGIIKQITGIHNIEVINPYFLRLSFGRLFPFEEIKEKVSNVYMYVMDEKVMTYNSEKERHILINEIIFWRNNYGRNHWTDVSGDKEKCMGCCLCNDKR